MNRTEKLRKDDACVRELLAQGKGVKEIAEEAGEGDKYDEGEVEKQNSESYEGSWNLSAVI